MINFCVMFFLVVFLFLCSAYWPSFKFVGLRCYLGRSTSCTASAGSSWLTFFGSSHILPLLMLHISSGILPMLVQPPLYALTPRKWCLRVVERGSLPAWVRMESQTIRPGTTRSHPPLESDVYRTSDLIHTLVILRIGERKHISMTYRLHFSITVGSLGRALCGCSLSAGFCLHWFGFLVYKRLSYLCCQCTFEEHHECK